MTNVLRFPFVFVLVSCGLSAAPQGDEDKLVKLSEDQSGGLHPPCEGGYKQ